MFEIKEINTDIPVDIFSNDFMKNLYLKNSNKIIKNIHIPKLKIKSIFLLDKLNLGSIKSLLENPPKAANIPVKNG